MRARTKSKNQSKIPVSIRRRIYAKDDYNTVLSKAHAISKELQFFEEVLASSLLPFDLHFEMHDKKKKIDTNEFEKKLYGFCAHKEESFKIKQIKIAYFLFEELAKRSPTAAQIELKKEIPKILND